MSATACARYQVSPSLVWKTPDLNTVAPYWTPCKLQYSLFLKDMLQCERPVSFMSSHRSQVDLRKLKRNGIIVAEALARYMYNLSDKVIK